MRLLERLFRKNCGALERFLTCFVRRLGAPYVVRLLERFLRIVRRLASILTWQHCCVYPMLQKGVANSGRSVDARGS